MKPYMTLLRFQEELNNSGEGACMISSECLISRIDARAVPYDSSFMLINP